MSLLYNTNIQELVNRNIKGNVARVGGRMNQLMSYKNCKVTDINIIDGGYGQIRNNFNLNSINNFYRTTKRQIRQEASWMLHGEREMRDRKTIILDMHFATLNTSLQNKFDSIVSSNVIEHSPDPIWLMLNFHFVTKESGYQYHAIPNYRYTFDQFRKPTPIEHIIEDFENITWFDDICHNDDYIMSAVEKHGHQRTFHEEYPVSYPYMHFHVFDENNVRKFAEYMFEDVTVDCLKDEKVGDNVVIMRNKLNPQFLKKNFKIIEAHKQFVTRMKDMNYSKIK